MQITRLQHATRYTAAKHFDMSALRLQGLDASPARFAWVGLSHFLPGGGAEMDTGATEKIYVMLAGEITIELEGGAVEQLGPLDSCHLAAGETRAVRNERNEVATMLVIVPGPDRPA